MFLRVFCGSSYYTWSYRFIYKTWTNTFFWWFAPFGYLYIFRFFFSNYIEAIFHSVYAAGVRTHDLLNVSCLNHFTRLLALSGLYFTSKSKPRRQMNFRKQINGVKKLKKNYLPGEFCNFFFNKKTKISWKGVAFKHPIPMPLGLVITPPPTVFLDVQNRRFSYFKNISFKGKNKSKLTKLNRLLSHLKCVLEYAKWYSWFI